jgi:hypothetical protein
MTRNFVRMIALMSITALSIQTYAQTNPGRIPSPSIPFLKVAPDARAAAMGDVGVATSADANALYWNPSKLVFAEKATGVAVSYTPWLRQLVNDMSIYYLAGYHKIAKDQVLGLSINYFDMGEFQATTQNGQVAGNFYSRDLAISGSYARKLSRNMSLGISLRYINSNPAAGAPVINGIALKPGTTVAGDIGLYYQTDNRDKKMNWAYGATISNLGGQVSYGGVQKNFIPTNLRFGVAGTYKINEQNKFVFAVDLNKLMVPTPPLKTNQSTLAGIFGSFGDAPDGFSEEVKEVQPSLGIEYWYNDLFAIRTGYRHESEMKGGQQYLTMGFGARIQQRYGLDFAYLVPMKQNSPLAQTLRLSLLINLDKKDRQADDFENDADSN